MTNEELALTFKVIGGIISLLMGCLAFFQIQMILEQKSVRKDVQRVLLTMGIIQTEQGSLKKSDDFMMIKLHDNEKQWTNLYKDHELPLKK